MKKLLCFALFIPFFVVSQQSIKGIVLDKTTNKPLPFATIATNSNLGTLTDVKGNFYLTSRTDITSLKISYIGYKGESITISPNQKFIMVKLEPSVESLREVLITAKENPAITLIKKTIKAKNYNNIEEALNSFKFNTYNKILVTANPDSINGKIDSIFKIKNGIKTFEKVDSTNYKFSQEIETKHLYISEKISEFNFSKGKKTKEIILASRMAGLKNPIYELLAITFQDFSIYNEYYTVAGTNYTNPIASNALKHYNYKILDTVNIDNRKTILVYFKPKEKKEYLGIEGVLYIDSKNFGIAKSIAELKGILNVAASQNYSFRKNDSIWFPSEMDIIIKKGLNNEALKLFGG